MGGGEGGGLQKKLFFYSTTSPSHNEIMAVKSAIFLSFQ